MICAPARAAARTVCSAWIRLASISQVAGIWVAATTTFLIALVLQRSAARWMTALRVARVVEWAGLGDDKAIEKRVLGGVVGAAFYCWY